MENKLEKNQIFTTTNKWALIWYYIMSHRYKLCSQYEVFHPRCQGLEWWISCIRPQRWNMVVQEAAVHLFYLFRHHHKSSNCLVQYNQRVLYRHEKQSSKLVMNIIFSVTEMAILQVHRYHHLRSGQAFKVRFAYPAWYMSKSSAPVVSYSRYAFNTATGTVLYRNPKAALRMELHLRKTERSFNAQYQLTWPAMEKQSSLLYRKMWAWKVRKNPSILVNMGMACLCPWHLTKQHK